MVRTILLLLGLVAASVGIAQTDRPLFFDDFSKYPAGSDGSPTWTLFAGQEKSWVVRDGRFHHTSSGWDQGASVDVQPKGRYTISVRTRAENGFPGGGIFFHMRNQVHTANCQMVRIDPEGVMWGPIDTVRTFQFAGMWNQKLSAGRDYVLAVAVDQDLGKYNVLLDGKIVGRNLDLRYLDGRVGLQSSGGPNSFDDVTVRPATPAELEGLKINEPFNAPQAVAVGPLGRLYVAHRGKNTIAIVSTGDAMSANPRPFGQVVGQMAPRGRGEGQVLDPVAVAVDRSGQVYVLDRERNAVSIYDQDGGFIRTISSEVFDPSGMALMPDGSIVVVSPGVGVAVLKPTGGVIARFGDASQFKSPEGVTVDPAGRILVADTGNHEIDILGLGTDGQIRPAGKIPGWLAPRSLAVNNKGQIVHLGKLGYYEEGGAVRLIDPQGGRLAHFAAFSIGGLGTGGGIALGADDTVYAVDAKNNRIVVIPPDLREPRPSVDVTGDQATITWTANHSSFSKTPWLDDLPEPANRTQEDGRFRYGTDKNPAAWKTTVANTREVSTVPTRGRRKMTLKGLPRNTFIYYQFAPSIRTIPETEWSKTYSLLTAPPAGQMQYIRHRAVAAIYLNTVDRNGKPFRLARADLGDRVQRMMERGREFYWRNTHFKFHQEIDYVVIEDAAADITDRLPPLEQVKKDIQASGDFQGMNINDYESVFAIWAGPRYRKDQPEAVGEVHGPGLTPYGYSAFSGEDTIAWLNVHEFNHQVDNFFDREGYPEFWLNHPDYTIHPGRYGGQYDVNAFIFREWPVNDWFWLPANDVGQLVLTDDRDGDGVPDYDTRVPLDEQRMGSDPAKKDTDGDGLDDFGEAMAGIFRGTDPRRPDTDNDGSIDSRDPWPLDAAVQDRPRKTPTINGIISPDEWTPLAALKGPFNGTTYLNWDEDAIYVAIKADRPFLAEIQLDPQNNGIFPGENIEMRVDATKGSGEAPIRNGKGSYGVVFNRYSVPGTTSVEIVMPRNPDIRLMPQMYQSMGLSIQVLDNEGRWVSVFEPWRLWEFRLMNPALDAPGPAKR